MFLYVVVLEMGCIIIIIIIISITLTALQMRAGHVWCLLTYVHVHLAPPFIRVVFASLSLEYEPDPEFVYGKMSEC